MKSPALFSIKTLFCLDITEGIIQSYVCFIFFQVYSGYRFVSAAHDQKKQIAIVNIGKTRADNLASIKISGKCSNILKSIQLTS